MSKKRRKQTPVVKPEDTETETRETLATAGKVIRPRLETGSYLLGLGVLLITCLLLVPLIQNELVLVLALVGIAVIFIGGLYFLLVLRR